MRTADITLAFKRVKNMTNQTTQYTTDTGKSL